MRRRPPGVGCRHPGRKACRRNAVTSIEGTRLCAMHASDRLFSKQVRAAEECWAAGYRFACAGGWQCCHIVTRARRATRWTHAVCMCAGHHKWFSHNVEAWREFVRSRGVDYDEINYLSVNAPPERAEDALARLLETVA